MVGKLIRLSRDAQLEGEEGVGALLLPSPTLDQFVEMADFPHRWLLDFFDADAADGAFDQDSAFGVGLASLFISSNLFCQNWKPGFRIAHGAMMGMVANQAPLRSGATGGVSDLNEWYFNAEGNWRYDPARDRWDPLAPTRDNANSRAVVVSDRYLVLLGGYKYSNTWSVDGTSSYVYSSEETLANERQRTVDAAMGAPALMRAEVSVYDTVTGRQALLAPLLDPSAWPMGVADGNSIYCLGGEGGKRLWHPATFQIGRLELPASRQATR